MRTRTRIALELFAAWAIPTAVLYDYGPVHWPSVAAAVTLYGMFAIMAAAAIHAAPRVGLPPPGPRLSRLILQVKTILVVSACMLLTVIWGHREGIELLTRFSGEVAEIVAAAFPGIGEIPEEMRREGFTARFEVTRDAAAFGYLAAIVLSIRLLLPVLANWRFLARMVLRAARARRLRGSKLSVFPAPVALVLLAMVLALFVAALLLIVFDGPGVRMEPSSRSLYGGDYEFYDTSLFWAMWTQPVLVFALLLLLCAAGAVIACALALRLRLRCRIRRARARYSRSPTPSTGRPASGSPVCP